LCGSSVFCCKYECLHVYINKGEIKVHSGRTVIILYFACVSWTIKMRQAFIMSMHFKRVNMHILRRTKHFFLSFRAVKIILIIIHPDIVRIVIRIISLFNSD